MGSHLRCKHRISKAIELMSNRKNDYEHSESTSRAERQRLFFEKKKLQNTFRNSIASHECCCQSEAESKHCDHRKTSPGRHGVTKQACNHEAHKEQQCDYAGNVPGNGEPARHRCQRCTSRVSFFLFHFEPFF